MFFTFSGDGNHGHRPAARLEIQTTIQDKIQQLYLWHGQMLVCPLSTSRERTLRQKKALWELFQRECVQISASLICHSKKTQNEFKYHSLKDLICERGTMVHIHHKIPQWDAINKSKIVTSIFKKLPSNMCRGKPQIFGAEHRNDCDNYQPNILPSFLIPFLLVFAPVHMLYSNCQDNNLVSSANRKYLSKINHY